MSNIYCTVAQFKQYLDERTVRELSGDDNDGVENTTNIQTILDAQASELDSMLYGRFSVTAGNVPAILTKWVAMSSALQMAARRSTPYPEALANQRDWVDNFAEKIRLGKMNLSGYTRTCQPGITQRADTQNSPFDNIMYFSDTPYNSSTTTTT